MANEINEIARPEWRDARAYAGVLSQDQVKAKIMDGLVSRYEIRYGIRFGDTPAKEVNLTLDLLLRDIRLFDTKDLDYWFYSFLLVAAYLFAEFWIVHTSSFQSWVFILLIVIVLFVLVFSLAAAFYIIQKEHRKPGGMKPLTKYIAARFIHILPVLLVSLGLATINFYLITKTGWDKSPFFPSLIFVAMNIISAPRENNLQTVILIFIAVVFIVFPFFRSLDNNTKITAAANVDRDLANYLNVVTLFFSVLIRIMQRLYSTIKILR